MFLDWEKAFDKIHHHKLIEALVTLKVDSHLISLVEAIYKNPTFCVSIDGNTSNTFPQTTGIRQGCPLSPYLFRTVMHCIFQLVEQDPLYPTHGKCKGINFFEILYADDTVLFGKDPKSIEIIFALIENYSAEFGLKLNRETCVHLPLNSPKHINYQDGTTVPKHTETTYLGSNINQKADPDKEIMNRIQECLGAWKRMQIFF